MLGVDFVGIVELQQDEAAAGGIKNDQSVVTRVHIQMYISGGGFAPIIAVGRCWNLPTRRMVAHHLRSSRTASVIVIVPTGGAATHRDWTRWKNGLAARQHVVTCRRLPSNWRSWDFVARCRLLTSAILLRALVTLAGGMETVWLRISNSKPSTSSLVSQAENFSSLMTRGPKIASIARRSAWEASIRRSARSGSTRSWSSTHSYPKNGSASGLSGCNDRGDSHATNHVMAPSNAA